MSGIEKYMNIFNDFYVDLELLELAKDASKVYNIKRKDILTFKFPSVENVTSYTISCATNSSYFDSTQIPPVSLIDKIIQEFTQNGYDIYVTRIIIHSQVFTLQDIESFLRIHNLKLLRRQVENEVKWFSATQNMTVPDTSAIIDDNLVQQFSKLLLNGVDNRIVRPDLLYILHSDISNLTGTKWCNIALINMFLDMINSCHALNKTTTASTFYYLSDASLSNLMEEWKRCQVRGCTVILNVMKTKTRNGETLISSKGEFGSHWSCIFFDFHTNNVIYCDSLAWDIPKNLSTELQRPLASFFRVLGVYFNLDKIIIAHKHPNETCNDSCLPLPFQFENQDICGFACLLTCMVLTSYSDMLWDRQIRNDLLWVYSLNKYSAYLRKYFICCYMNNSLDFSLISKDEESFVICNLDEEQKRNNNDNCNENVNVTSHEDDIGETSGRTDASVERNDICGSTEGYGAGTDADITKNPMSSDQISNSQVDTGDIQGERGYSNYFEVGNRFESYLQLKAAIKEYETVNYVQICVKDCCTKHLIALKRQIQSCVTIY